MPDVSECYGPDDGMDSGPQATVLMAGLNYYTLLSSRAVSAPSIILFL
jgi:hypothetical protein